MNRAMALHLAPEGVGPTEQAVAVVLDRYRSKVVTDGAEAAWAWLSSLGKSKALGFLKPDEKRDAVGRIFAELVLTSG